MTDLERLEMILRRMHNERKQASETTNMSINVDIQDLLSDLVNELAWENSRQ